MVPKATRSDDPSSPPAGSDDLSSEEEQTIMYYVDVSIKQRGDNVDPVVDSHVLAETKNLDAAKVVLSQISNVAEELGLCSSS